MNTLLFLLLVLGVPAVAWFRARWLEESIGLDRGMRADLAEIDLEIWDREMGEAR